MDIFQELIVNTNIKLKNRSRGPDGFRESQELKIKISKQLSNPPHYTFEYPGRWALYYVGPDGQEYAWLDLVGHNGIEFLEEYRKNNELSNEENDFIESIEGKYVSIIKHMDDMVELDEEYKDKILQFQIHMSRCQLHMKGMPDVDNCKFVSFDGFFQVIKEQLEKVYTVQMFQGEKRKISLYQDLLFRVEEFQLTSV